MAAGMGCCQMTGSPFRAAEGVNPWVTTAVRLSIVREECGGWEFERVPHLFNIGAPSVASSVGEVLVRVAES